MWNRKSDISGASASAYSQALLLETRTSPSMFMEEEHGGSSSLS